MHKVAGERERSRKIKKHTTTKKRKKERERKHTHEHIQMKRKKDRERLDTFYYLLGGVFCGNIFLEELTKTQQIHTYVKAVIVKVFAF
jgi:hypothetical protein